MAYTALFCEENIWTLARERQGQDETTEVWLFSNPAKQILLGAQNLGQESNGWVLWDYHVVLVTWSRDGSGPLQGRVWDYDSLCAFPCLLADYLALTLAPDTQHTRDYLPWVRRISAAHYLRHFSSDRSHMQGQVPEQDFPDWPMIQAEPEQAVSLQRYWDMTQAITRTEIVEVLSVESFADTGGLLNPLAQ